MRESKYQASLIDKLQRLFPGCKIVKNDTLYQQGMPDLSIFFGDRWAMLEVKASSNSASQPNQDYYINTFGQMSFAAFIYPENEKDVLNDLEQHMRRQ